MLLEKVAELENVEVSGDEIAGEINKMAQYYGVGAEQIRKSLTEQGGENSIADRLRSRKAVESLVANSKVIEAEWLDESQTQAAQITEAVEEKPKKGSKKKAVESETVEDSKPKKKKAKATE